MCYIPHCSSSTTTNHYPRSFKKAERALEESKHPLLVPRMSREERSCKSEDLPSSSLYAIPRNHLSLPLPPLKGSLTSISSKHSQTNQAGVTNPPAISTHSGIQLPSLPSTSTISVSHRHLHPTPFSFSVSHLAQ
jgi:hypothetical protein